MPKYAKSFQTWTSRRFGRQDYTTLAGPDGLRLSTQRTVQRQTTIKKKNGELPDYKVGVNSQVINQIAPARFQAHLISCNVDETRGRMELVRQGIEITGDQWSANCCDWLPENRCYVPETKEELIDMIVLHRELQLLSGDLSTHQFRSLTDRKLPSLTYAIIPIAAKGNTAFQTLKYWMHIINSTHQAMLNFKCFCADMCASALCAGTILGKPSSEFVDLGCSYVGLPADDFKYFAIYCEPAPNVVKHLSGEEVRVPRPLPKQYLADGPHLQRSYRNNLDALAFLPFYCTKVDTVEGCIAASYGCLREMAASRLGEGMKLSEIININSYAEFRNDSAYNLVHQDLIDLLTLHHPEDKATILTMQAMHFMSEVYRNKAFTNPWLATWYVSACASVWELQERYVTKVLEIDRPSDCLPSYQFRAGIDISANFAINHFISFYLDAIPRGFNWSQCSLSEVNQDELEGTHSRARHRSNGKMDVNFNVAEYADNMIGMQEEADSKRELQEGGLEFGEPKHTQNTYQGKYGSTHNTLGQFEDDCAFKKSHLSYSVPDTIDEFIDDLLDAREAGTQWGRGRYVKMGPHCKEQFIGAGQWEERVLVPECDENLSYVQWRSPAEIAALPPQPTIAVMRRVRDKQDFPDGFVIANGTNTNPEAAPCDKLPLPTDFILPEDLVVPKKEAAAIRKIEKEMNDKAKALEPELTLMSDIDCDGIDGSEHQALLLSKLGALKKKSFEYREGLKSKSLPPTKKRRKNVLAIGTCSEITTNMHRIFSGQVVRCSDGSYESTDRIIARYQRHERIDRERRRRFMKYRIRGFTYAMQAGHDVTLGTCMAIKWGKESNFAVVRVYKMFDEKGERAFSMKLSKKCKKSQYRVELLIPIGATELGSQRYRSSGWNLGPIGGAMVICMIDLLPTSSLQGMSRESRLHDAILPLQTIQELQHKGLHQLSVDANGELDVLGNDPIAERTNGWSLGERCYRCKLLWFDHKTGSLVKCTKCTRVYHQDCADPVIKNDEVEAFECSVCRGDDTDLCCICNEPFTEREVDDRDSTENNELVACEPCGKWYHQSCHRPAVYPLPIGNFTCCNCIESVGAAPAPMGPSQSQQNRRRRKPRQPAAMRPPPAAPTVDRPRRSNRMAYAPSATLAPSNIPANAHISVFWYDD